LTPSLVLGENDQRRRFVVAGAAWGGTGDGNFDANASAFDEHLVRQERGAPALRAVLRGQLKGRYVIAFLVGVEFLGGAQLRKKIEFELGDPVYGPDAWAPARDIIVIFDRAARAGVDVERMGELVMPAFKRAHPQLFVGKTVLDAFDILESGYRTDTTYGGVSPEAEKNVGRLRVFRTGSPVPCQYFVGVVKGLLQVFGVAGSVREIACQWEGGKSCCFEARWR
jgi:hypothetical protein